MIRLYIEEKIQPQHSQSNFTYTLTNQVYQANIEIDEFKNFNSSKTTVVANPPLTVFKRSNQFIYNQIALIGENRYDLKVFYDNNYYLQHQSQSFVISKNEIIALINKLDIILLSGPVLILNLALNHIFCLHASAFVLNNKVFILMADSGTGKSTIARYIDKHSKGQRIADDIVPLEMLDGKITVLPDFPQLKLPPEQQYHGQPIQKQVVLLFAKKTTGSTSMHKINPFLALKKLIQHSVATKLFAANELQNHLNFCFQISQKTQAYQVAYAHTENSLQDLLNQVNEIL